MIVKDGSGTDIARGVTELQQDGLRQIFDEQKVNEQMELAQVAGEVGFTAAKDLIMSRRDAATKELDQASEDYQNATTEEEKTAALQRKEAAQASLKQWSDGGSAKLGTQVLAGVLQASLGGSDPLGAASGVAADEFLLTKLSAGLNNKGLDADGAGHDIAMTLAGIGMGWAAGAVVGDAGAGATAASAAQQYGYYDYRDGRKQAVQSGTLREMAGGDEAVLAAMQSLINEAIKNGADPASLAASLSTPDVAQNLVGMAVVETAAQKQFGSSFKSLSEAEQRALIERLQNAQVSVGPVESVGVTNGESGVGAGSSALASQPDTSMAEESFEMKAGRVVSGLIENGGRGVEKAVDWVGADNATALAYVAMVALGGPIKTLGSAIWENSPLGEQVQQAKQQYLVDPLGRVIGTYGFGAETDDQLQAVQPASSTMAGMGVDSILSAIGAQAAGKGAKKIVDGSDGFGKKIDDADAGISSSTVNTGAVSANAQDALNRKLSALEKAQNNAAKTKTLPDGRVRYYASETPARTPGPTRGASLVTEHDPKTGQVRQWMESYDSAGNVIRVHPKMIDGQPVESQHYPPTGKELGGGQ